MSDVRAVLLAQLAANEEHARSLAADHARLLAASESSNSDDEHDPEGSTIAYERQLLMALRRQADAARADIEAALSRFEADTYGRCESCGSAIGAARLIARPQARTCMRCAV